MSVAEAVAGVLEASRGGMVKCPECGTLNVPGAAKCKSCGKALAKVTEKAKGDGRSNVQEGLFGKARGGDRAVELKRLADGTFAPKGTGSVRAGERLLEKSGMKVKVPHKSQAGKFVDGEVQMDHHRDKGHMYQSVKLMSGPDKGSTIQTRSDDPDAPAARKGRSVKEAVAAVLESTETAKLSVSHAPLGKGGKNWITASKPGNTGQLPAYIQNVRNGIMKDGKSESSATAIAISRVRSWATGGGNVGPEVRAAAAKAVAEFEAMRAKSKAGKVAEAVFYRLMEQEAEGHTPGDGERAAMEPEAKTERVERVLPPRDRRGTFADLVTLATGRREPKPGVATAVAEAVWK